MTASQNWEICGALADEIDSLDVGTIEALFEAMKSMHARLDDGRPATAVFRTWLGTWSERGERFRLAYDPSEALSSTQFSDINGEALEPLLTTTLDDMAQGGHAIFATGPLPLRGVFFGREGPLFEALSKQAPEAADLYLLLSVDGDYSDINGPLGEHWYWTGEGVDPDAVIFPDAIDRARRLRLNCTAGRWRRRRIAVVCWRKQSGANRPSPHAGQAGGWPIFLPRGVRKHVGRKNRLVSFSLIGLTVAPGHASECFKAPVLKFSFSRFVLSRRVLGSADLFDYLALLSAVDLGRCCAVRGSWRPLR
jgi:hypothetical protein